MPQLRLWARMINCGTHDGYDIPSVVPMFSTTQPKRPRRESLADKIAEGVTAPSKALGCNTAQSLPWLQLPPWGCPLERALISE